MTLLRHRVLDIVECSGVHQVAGRSSRGVVTQVREYPDGRLRYSVGIDGEALLVDADSLTPTGMRDTIANYLPPGSVFPGDEVEIRLAAGVLRGVVDAWFDEEGITQYAVWIPSTGMVEIASESDLVRVGPSDIRRRGPAQSTRVSESGVPVGTDDYMIVEDLMDFIAEESRASS